MHELNVATVLTESPELLELVWANH